MGGESGSVGQPLHTRTPLLHSEALSRVVGRPVYLKLENLQPTGSFKLRGIGRLCAAAAAAGARLFVSSSGGNAGLAAAHSARRLGLPAVVVVPRTTDPRMQALIAAEGAEVILHGESWPEADQRARELVASGDGVYVHPFDHPEIWAGHATLVDELAEELEPPGCLVVSVGGGGLLAGVLEGLRRHRWTGTRVVAAETAGAACLEAAMAAGRPVTLERMDTVARSLGSPRVAQGAFDRLRGWDVQPWVLPDRSAVAACRRFLDDHRMLVEPACGAALSAAYERAPGVTAAGSVVVVVCGGAGITAAELDEHARRLLAAPA